MRVRSLTWVAIVAGMLAGCTSSRSPFATNPLLIYYRPALSDSETVLAGRAAPRGPTQPPVPAFASEQKDPVSSVAVKPASDPIVPAKAEAQPTPVAPTEMRPIIRQTSETSQPAIKVPAAQPALFSELKPILVSAPAAASASPPPVTFPDAIVTKRPELDPIPMAKPTAQGPVAATLQVEPGTGKRTVTGRFGHDADYRWLQGVIEKNFRGNYFIRYCDPAVDDEYGGKFLVDEARLGSFHEGDVIGVEGDLDKFSAGEKGQTPKYTIRNVWLVKGK